MLAILIIIIRVLRVISLGRWAIRGLVRRELRFSIAELRDWGDGSTRGWGLGLLALLTAHEEEYDATNEGESNNGADDSSCDPGL